MPAAALRDLLFDQLTTAVLVFDPDLKLMEMNPSAEALLGLSTNKVRGMAVEGLFAGAEACRPALERIYEDRPFTEREMALTLVDGRTVTVDCAVTPLGRGPDSPGLLVELMQLDRHKRLSREEQLLSQNESARTLTRRLAHEVRNPLGGLRGAAQLLARELHDEGLKEYTAVIVREADRLQNLMDRLLGPRSVPRQRSVNIHEVTERVRALAQAEAPLGISVERDYDPSVPEVYADPDRLIQAVLNVARNAVQSLGDHGHILFTTRVHHQLTIGQKRHRMVVRIDIADDGPGIPEDIRESIFYPMVTGREEGTGLGLAIAQSLVSQNGGLIECDSEPGNTVFRILLPVQESR